MDKKLQMERNIGIDLLRIVSMLMVVLLHVLGQGGILASTGIFSINYNIVWILEIAAYCAVNCYALITGYVSINRTINYTKIILFWIQVTFWPIIITLIVAIINPSFVGIKEILKSITPITSSQYWYTTAYFALLFFIPILNHIINTVEKEALKKFIFSCLILFSLLPTLRRYDIFGTVDGYSLLWLMILYIIGAYIKKYINEEKYNKKVLISLYMVCIVLTFGFKIVMELATTMILGNARGGMFLINYTSPTILASGVIVLIYFLNIQVKNKGLEKLILKISTCAFGVYLIHTNPLIWQYVLKDSFSFLATYNPILMIIYITLWVIVIFSVCTILEASRIYLFNVLKVDKFCIKLELIINNYIATRLK